MGLQEHLSRKIQQTFSPRYSWQDLWPALPSVDLNQLSSADFDPDTGQSRLFSIYLETQRKKFLESEGTGRFWLLFADYQIAEIGIKTGQISFDQFQDIHGRFYRDVSFRSSVCLEGLVDLGFIWLNLVKDQSSHSRSSNPGDWQILEKETAILIELAIHKMPNSLPKAKYLSDLVEIYPELDLKPKINQIISAEVSRIERQNPKTTDLYQSISDLMSISAHIPSCESVVNRLLARTDISKLDFGTVRALVRFLPHNKTLPEWQKIQFTIQINSLIDTLPKGDIRDGLLEGMVRYYCSRDEFDRALELWQHIDKEVYLTYGVGPLAALSVKLGRSQELSHQFETTYVPKITLNDLSRQSHHRSTVVPNSNDKYQSALDSARWWSLNWYLAAWYDSTHDWLSLPEVQDYIHQQPDNHFGFDELLNLRDKFPHPWINELISRRFKESASKFEPADPFNEAHGLAYDLLLWSIRKK